jgi:hypothetical protein
MTPPTLNSAGRLAFRAHGSAKAHIVTGAVAIVFALVGMTALAPPRPATAAEIIAGYNDVHGQKVTVSNLTVAPVIERDTFTATLGAQELAGVGTNFDWAKLVLSYGGWPASDSNVTVFTRWMRQENGANNWWNRNNPLNNGWGSGGAAGTGSYPNLIQAAKMAAEALHSNPGYSQIVHALAAGTNAKTLEHAIWASPWATGHYANGGHWSYVPVPAFKAPKGSW